MDMEDPLYIHEKFHINDDAQTDRCKLLAEWNPNMLQRYCVYSFKCLKIIAPDDVIKNIDTKFFKRRVT